jgi:hypothetical protein
MYFDVFFSYFVYFFVLDNFMLSAERQALNVTTLLQKSYYWSYLFLQLNLKEPATEFNLKINLGYL